MIYKKIDLTRAIMSNVEIEAAESFVDMRLSIKKPLTQRAFNQNMDKAVFCQNSGLCTATEAADLASENCWQGITPEYVASHLNRRMMAIQEVKQVTTKKLSLDHDLNDTSWAN